MSKRSDNKKRIDGSVVSTASPTVSATFIEHNSFLKKFLTRYFSSEQDIDEIAQEAFLKAFEAEKHQEIRSPKSFLFHIAKNAALHRLARKSRVITDYIEDLGNRELSSEAASVEEQVAASERMAVFCQAAASLPTQCRRAFLMRKVYGFSHKEIAERLGISKSTVEKHMAKGLQRSSAFMRDKGQLAEKVAEIRKEPNEQES